jgi:hypothetical protein
MPLNQTLAVFTTLSSMASTLPWSRHQPLETVLVSSFPTMTMPINNSTAAAGPLSTGTILPGAVSTVTVIGHSDAITVTVLRSQMTTARPAASRSSANTAAIETIARSMNINTPTSSRPLLVPSYSIAPIPNILQGLEISFPLHPTNHPVSSILDRATPTIPEATTISSTLHPTGNPAPPYSNNTAHTYDDVFGGVAAWWGQHDAPLSAACAGNKFSIIVLSFLNIFHAAGGYPGIDLNGLSSPSAAQEAAGATDLKDGSTLVPDIRACQAAGKKVLLSLGGYEASSTFKSDEDATQFAEVLWNLFLGGKENPELRVFGDVTLDGIDIDNESHDPTGYVAFVAQLRSRMVNDFTGKKYLITAAPQCPRANQIHGQDESIPDAVLSLCDIVWVQFCKSSFCSCLV